MGKDLPRWFWRIYTSAWYQNCERAVAPRDFDEDLSEMDTDEERRELEDMYGEHNSDGDWDTYSGDSDYESVNACDEFAADDYHELKEMRQQRKIFKLKQRWKREQKQKRLLSFQDKVHAALQSLSESKEEETPLDELDRQVFRLYRKRNPDNGLYVDDHLLPGSVAVVVGFYRPKEGASCEPETTTDESGDLLFGKLRLDNNKNYRFSSFLQPPHASQTAITCNILSRSPWSEVSLQFLGGGHLILQLRKADTPQVVEFAGILFDREKERAEREEKERIREENRPASPKETYFEMNHPMGSWRSGF